VTLVQAVEWGEVSGRWCAWPVRWCFVLVGLAAAGSRSIGAPGFVLRHARHSCQTSIRPEYEGLPAGRRFKGEHRADCLHRAGPVPSLVCPSWGPVSGLPGDRHWTN